MFKAEKQQENSIKFQVKILVGKNFPNAQEPNEMSTLWAWAHYSTKRHFKWVHSKKNHVFQHLHYKILNFLLNFGFIHD